MNDLNFVGYGVCVILFLENASVQHSGRGINRRIVCSVSMGRMAKGLLGLEGTFIEFANGARRIMTCEWMQLLPNFGSRASQMMFC